MQFNVPIHFILNAATADSARQQAQVVIEQATKQLDYLGLRYTIQEPERVWNANSNER